MLCRKTAHSRIETSMLFVCGRNGLFIIISTGRWGFKDLIQTYSHLFMLFQKMSLLSDGHAFISAQPRPPSICVSSKGRAFHQCDSICFFSFARTVFYLSLYSSDCVRRSRAKAMIKCRLESESWSECLDWCWILSQKGYESETARRLQEWDSAGRFTAQGPDKETTFCNELTLIWKLYVSKGKAGVLQMVK